MHHAHRRAGQIGSSLFGLGLLYLGGCGSEPPPDTTKFVGTWKVESGQVEPKCASIQGAPMLPKLDLTGQSVKVAAGTSAPLAIKVETPGGNCDVNFDIQSETGVARAGQLCPLKISTMVGSTPMTFEINVTVNTGVFMVTGAAGNLTLGAKGSTKIAALGGVPIECPVDMKATVKKE